MKTRQLLKYLLMISGLLLGVLAGVGCLPGQVGMEPAVPTAIAGATAAATPVLITIGRVDAQTATPTVVVARTEVAEAHPQPAPTRLQLTPGAAESITGPMDGQNQVHYLMWVAAGQTLAISVTSPNNGVLFHLLGASDGQDYKHLLDGELSWQGTLPHSQDYWLVLDAVGGPTTYTLHLSLSEDSPPTPTSAAAIPGGPLYPVVDAAFGYLLGGTQNGRWLDAHTYAAYLQDTERPYTLYTLAGAAGTVTGYPPVTAGICAQPQVALQPVTSLDGIALITTWEAAPRRAQALATDTAVYQEAVTGLLQAQGIAEPEVRISSIQRIDLEGDGVDEVLIAASRLVAGASAPPVAAGDYSLVVLRQVVGDTVVTTPLALDVYPEANDLAYPHRYDILGLLDLNGDNRLEIIIAADRYEGRAGPQSVPTTGADRSPGAPRPSTSPDQGAVGPRLLFTSPRPRRHRPPRPAAHPQTDPRPSARLHSRCHHPLQRLCPPLLPARRHPLLHSGPG